MRKIQLLVILCSVLFIGTPNAKASGGSVGLTPATGVKLYFAKGGTSTFLPFRFEGEGYLGGNDQHGVGGGFGYDIGVGGARTFWGVRANVGYLSISPEYKYYFKGGKDSSPFVGAYTDFRFGSGRNIIGVGAQGGYQHVFDFGLGIYGVGSFGFGTAGNNSGFGRSNGGEFGMRAGVKYIFGKN
ncbi:MAG: hypothetical protein KDD32_01820 [Bacteroidetes bacterium]|nr:hypothetical protein [Bacteroidota bacterium]